jgi:large subunit ribosomal protein L21
MADTYAIVESGGKQYRAEEGASLLVDRLPGEEGEKVNLRAVMFRADKVVVEPKELEKVKVEAVVAEQLRGPKVRVFKYRPKKGYRRRAGHRSELTKLEVKSVKMLSRRPAQKKESAVRGPQSADKKAPARKSTPKKDEEGK